MDINAQIITGKKKINRQSKKKKKNYKRIFFPCFPNLQTQLFFYLLNTNKFQRFLVSRGELDDTRNNSKKKKNTAQKKPKLRWHGKKEIQEDKTYHDECAINGDAYKVNDVVLIRCSTDQPRIAKIESMFDKKPGKKK